MNEHQLMKDGLDAVIRGKKQREADLAAGRIEPSRAPSFARIVVSNIAPGQEERLLGLLGLLSDVSLPALHASSLGKIAEMLAAAAREEGWERIDIPFRDRAHASVAWQDASDVDRAPLFDILRRLLGSYIEAAETDPVEVPSEEVEAEDPVVEPPVMYANVAPSVTIGLQYPFRLDGRMIRRITLRPPRFCDVQAVSTGKMERTAMIAEMTGVPVAAINALRWPDAERVVGTAMDMAPEHIGG